MAGYIRSVDLEGSVAGGASLQFLRAEMPLEPSPFALIRYSINGQEQRYGLRLDLDKQVFLDDLGDSAKDAIIAGAAPRVMSFCAPISSRKA